MPSEVAEKIVEVKNLASGAEAPIHFRRFSGPTEVGPFPKAWVNDSFFRNL
jgi:hypothetical protein